MRLAAFIRQPSAPWEQLSHTPLADWSSREARGEAGHLFIWGGKGHAILAALQTAWGGMGYLQWLLSYTKAAPGLTQQKVTSPLPSDSSSSWIHLDGIPHQRSRRLLSKIKKSFKKDSKMAEDWNFPWKRMSYIHIRLSPQPDLASSSALYTDMGEKKTFTDMTLF